MPEQRLDVHELGAGLQEPGGVGVAELVRRDFLVDAGAPGGFSPGALANTKSSRRLSEIQ